MSDVQSLLTQIQLSHANANRQSALLKAQIHQRERDIRLLQLTKQELEGFKEVGGEDFATWRGVGKMFIKENPEKVFKQIAGDQVEKRNEINELKGKQKIAEKEIAEANRAFREVLHQQQRQKDQTN